ncbi:WD40-repeat-containing domain [Pseudocohnilembus persalinus]|uniref:WD40-repeat-containing domain n=1 Tax=Pseudocohnilembus persalinus TaxID=266149 RepID=A0A0V0QCE1_PSEPJ|nr:WD40-repeat-containing domain [Pseudocohnilembus persalinus]|eukprot:KRW99842.1 WD40-repeat-containing domain [Pseudocohnilembus persalinus]
MVKEENKEKKIELSKIQNQQKQSMMIQSNQTIMGNSSVLKTHHIQLTQEDANQVSNQSCYDNFHHLCGLQIEQKYVPIENIVSQNQNNIAYDIFKTDRDCRKIDSDNGMYCIFNDQNYNITKPYQIIYSQQTASIFADNYTWETLKNPINSKNDQNNFWMGTEYIHNKCNQTQTCELTINFQSYYKNEFFQISVLDFYLENEDNNYKIHFNNICSNTVKDLESLNIHDQQFLSTSDKQTQGCSNRYQSPGFFKNCYKFNFLGQFYNLTLEEAKIDVKSGIEGQYLRYLNLYTSNYHLLSNIYFGIRQFNLNGEFNDRYQGKYFESNFCQQTTNPIENCSIYQQDNFCFYCQTGFYIDDNNSCQKCDDTCYTCLNQPSNCTINCNQNCKNGCNQSSICNECQENYVFNENMECIFISESLEDEDEDVDLSDSEDYNDSEDEQQNNSSSQNQNQNSDQNKNTHDQKNSNNNFGCKKNEFWDDKQCNECFYYLDICQKSCKKDQIIKTQENKKICENIINDYKYLRVIGLIIIFSVVIISLISAIIAGIQYYLQSDNSQQIIHQQEQIPIINRQQISEKYNNAQKNLNIETQQKLELIQNVDYQTDITLDQVSQIQYSPEGNFLYICKNTKLQILKYEENQQQLVQHQTYDEPCKSLAIKKNDSDFAYTDLELVFYKEYIDDDLQEFNIDQISILAYTYLEDFPYLAYNNDNQVIFQNQDQEEFTLELENQLSFLTFTDDSKYLLGCQSDSQCFMYQKEESSYNQINAITVHHRTQTFYIASQKTLYKCQKDNNDQYELKLDQQFEQEIVSMAIQEKNNIMAVTIKHVFGTENQLIILQLGEEQNQIIQNILYTGNGDCRVTISEKYSHIVLSQQDGLTSQIKVYDLCENQIENCQECIQNCPQNTSFTNCQLSLTCTTCKLDSTLQDGECILNSIIKQQNQNEQEQNQNNDNNNSNKNKCENHEYFANNKCQPCYWLNDICQDDCFYDTQFDQGKIKEIKNKDGSIKCEKDNGYKLEFLQCNQNQYLDQNNQCQTCFFYLNECLKQCPENKISDMKSIIPYFYLEAVNQNDKYTCELKINYTKNFACFAVVLIAVLIFSTIYYIYLYFKNDRKNNNKKNQNLVEVFKAKIKYYTQELKFLQNLLKRSQKNRLVYPELIINHQKKLKKHQQNFQLLFHTNSEQINLFQQQQILNYYQNQNNIIQNQQNQNNDNLSQSSFLTEFTLSDQENQSEQSSSQNSFLSTEESDQFTYQFLFQAQNLYNNEQFQINNQNQNNNNQENNQNNIQIIQNNENLNINQDYLYLENTDIENQTYTNDQI